MRKVHASTGCDACSVCARRNHKPRDEKSLRQLKWLSPWIGQSRLESATVTESLWKQREWNAVKPLKLATQILVGAWSTRKRTVVL